MIQENSIVLTQISLNWLDERLRRIEEKIEGKEAHKSEKDEWLPLQEFMDETGVKSHYSVAKMEAKAEERGLKFKSMRRGKRRYIHRSEVENFFLGKYE